VSDIEPASSEVNQSLERAIWLLTAFNADAQDQRGWLEQEVLRIRTADDPVTYVNDLGSTLAAMLQLAHYLLVGWARASGTDPEAVLAITRRIVEMERQGE
jgi:hypothetical protein